MKKLILSLTFILPLIVSARKTKDTTMVIPAVETTFRMAAQFAKYGYNNNDALSLIQAARLSKKYSFTEEASTKDRSEGDHSMSAEPAGKITLNVDELLNDAKTTAKDDGVLLALIDDVKSIARGAEGGPRYSRATIWSQGTDYYHVSFRVNEPAVITVIGDDESDLDLYVFDGNGELVDSDEDDSGDCVCSFIPHWHDKYLIRVVNRSNKNCRYVFRTN